MTTGDRGARRATSARRLALSLAGAALLGALCMIGLRRISFAALADAVTGARLPLVAAASLLTFVHIALKSERWRLMLAPVRPIPPLRLFHYLVVTSAASTVLPGPAGEALRVYLLRRRYGVPVPVSIAVALIEKLFEGVGLVLVVAPLPLLLALPRSISLIVVACSVGGAAATCVALALAARAARFGWKGRLARWSHLEPGILSLRSPSMFARASALSFAGHLASCAAVSLLLSAVGLDLPLAAGGLVVLALSFAIVVPLTPGHVGAIEASAVGALGLLGAPMEKALAFALVYHAMQVLPLVVLGLSGIGLVAEAREEQAKDGAAPPEEAG